MNKEEVENRILICEEREKGYREIGNTRIADKYSDEKYKWEELLSKLDSKRDEELRDYKKGYSNLKQALNEIRKYVVNLKENSVNSVCYLEEMYEIDVDIKQDILQRLDKYLGDEK